MSTLLSYPYLEFQNDTLAQQWTVEVSPMENKEDLEKRQWHDYASAKASFNFLKVDVLICKLLFCDRDPMSHMQLKYKQVSWDQVGAY